MNEMNALLAAKTIKQLKGLQPISSSDADDLISELTNDNNSLHLSFNKAYLDDGRSSEDMTIEEYRAFIEDKINHFIIHPQQKRVNYTIHITQTGLYAMKDDKKHERYVLSTIQTAFTQPYYSPFSENCLLYFDDIENSYSMCWSSMNNIKSGADIKSDNNEEETYDLSDINPELDVDSINEYTFKRFSPVSMFIPSSRYARALYAYNVPPENWLKRKSHNKVFEL